MYVLAAGTAWTMGIYNYPHAVADISHTVAQSQKSLSNMHTELLSFALSFFGKTKRMVINN